MAGNVQISLFAQDGRKVIARTIDNNGVWSADLSLPQGLYYIRLEQGATTIGQSLVIE